MNSKTTLFSSLASFGIKTWKQTQPLNKDHVHVVLRGSVLIGLILPRNLFRRILGKLELSLNVINTPAILL